MDKVAPGRTYITPEVVLTPEEKARNPLHVATDLCKADAPIRVRLGNVKRASSIFEDRREYLFAAQAARRAGDLALMICGVPTVESLTQYKNAIALYEKLIQDNLKDGLLKSAADAALGKGEVFGKLGLFAMKTDEHFRALDLLARDYWHMEASGVAKGLGLVEEARKYEDLASKPRSYYIGAAEAAAKASARA
jgi:tetratricopeptide (TPR) repeat protein